jgi:pheromone a factor receptor
LSNNSSLTRSRFLRLFILSILLLLIFLPITFYVFARNLDFEWLPYSWEEVHYGDNWLWIRKIPTNGNINFDRWVPIATGVLVFLIFGLGKDAMMLYRAWLNTIGVGRFLPKWIMEPRTPQSSLGPYSGGTTETTTTTTTTNAAATASTWLRRQRNPFRGKEDVEHSAVETDV